MLDCRRRGGHDALKFPAEHRLGGRRLTSPCGRGKALTLRALSTYLPSKLYKTAFLARTGTQSECQDDLLCGHAAIDVADKGLNLMGQLQCARVIGVHVRPIW